MNVALDDILKRSEARELETMFATAGLKFWEESDEYTRQLLVMSYMLGQMAAVIGPDRMTSLVKIVSEALPKRRVGDTAPPPEIIVHGRVCQRPASCGQPYCSCQEAVPSPELPEAAHG